MASTVRLLIVTPASKRFEGDAQHVVAPGAAGDLAALPNHAPLLTTLRPGLVDVKLRAADDAAAADPDAGRLEFAVDGGFMELLPDRVIVLTDRAVSKDEVDLEAVRAERRRAEEAIAQKRGVDDSEDRIALAFADAKLKLIGRDAE